MKIMTMADVKRLRVDGPSDTHLERFEAANNAGSKTVLDVRCPHCGARPTMWCLLKG